MGVAFDPLGRRHGSPQQHPYSSALSSSASSSSSSIFSADATSSQTSESTSYSSASISVPWDAEDSWHASTAKRTLPPLQVETTGSAIPLELRQHPRRCPVAAAQRAPPALVRQCERKGQFVDNLVDSATQMVEVIWPLAVPSCGLAERYQGQGVLPLRTFIQETLRRSRTSFSTLQVALYYLILIKSHVPKHDFTMEQPVDSTWSRTLQCGRRMFLAALILASKYLQDRNYSARAWSKISGLKVSEINTNEMAFLEAVNWKLHFPEPLFDRWQSILLKYTSQQPPSPASPVFPRYSCWKAIVPHLTPELDTVNLADEPVAFALPQPFQRYSTPAIVASNAMHGSVEPISPMLPRTLEPTPYQQPSTPAFVRLGPLPTPSLTPYSVVSSTPAVSHAGFEPQRHSSESAMAQIQGHIRREAYHNNRDEFWTQPSSGRRPSAVSSSSSVSSPESMVSDGSSRCSRASSISSTSSLTYASACAPTPVRLARMATLRCAGMKASTIVTPQQQQGVRFKDNVALGSITLEPLSAEPMSSPDLESFHIAEIESPSRSVFQLKENSATAPVKRKRGRSSLDLTLQQNVRNLLQASTLLAENQIEVLTDRSVATSFLLNTPSDRTPVAGLDSKALQSPARSVPERRLPVQKDLGRKRACCAPAQILDFSPQPVQWS